jgi:hypothetical protein
MAEGQTLKPDAIHLPSHVFPHGQLSAAFNRSSLNNVAVANIEHNRQGIEKDILITSPYIEKYRKFYKKYTNRPIF